MGGVRWAWPKMPAIELGIYRGRVYLTTSRDAFVLACRACGVEDDKADSAGAALDGHHPRLGRVYVIGVFDKDILTLQHEVNHVALDVIANCGFDAHNGRGEPFCYLAEMIFKAFYKRFLK